MSIKAKKASIRPVLTASSYDEACARSFEAQGKRLSQQSWAIYPKIRQLDDLLKHRPDLREKIFEVHPEVCFCAWNAMQPIVEPKKSKEGASIRRALVAKLFGPNSFDVLRSRYKRGDVADDDIVDAFAALWTAERIARRESAELPKQSQTDSAGLPMRMVY